MPIVHPDDGSPFFQSARTVLQQANFALDIHIVEPEQILSHYDRVQYLLQTLLRLSNTSHDGIDVDAWINAALQTSQNITQRLETFNEYNYNEHDDDAAVPHPLTIKLDQLDTDGRPRFLLP
jgi:hypothetical protein